jgi:protein-tyrosine-phosphatase
MMTFAEPSASANRRGFPMIFDRRRFGHLLAATGLAHSLPAAARPCATKVLFVCPMGSVKSAIAREKLRRIVKARGLAVEVQSRGLTPANDISPGLAAHLKGEGIDPLADPLRRFTPADAVHADITIAFDEAATAPGLERARAWHSPSWNDDYAHAKAVMDGHIGEFADELSKRPCAK